VASKKEETNGVYVVTPQTETAPVSLLAGKGKYQKLTWDEDQTELAFISDRDDAEAKQPKFKVYLWERGSSPAVRTSSDRNHATLSTPNAASEVVSTSSPGFRKDFVVSEKANLGFSLDGTHLFLGAAPPPEPEKNVDEEIPADEGSGRSLALEGRLHSADPKSPCRAGTTAIISCGLSDERQKVRSTGRRIAGNYLSIQ